jgi:hypothetical protein
LVIRQSFKEGVSGGFDPALDLLLLTGGLRSTFLRRRLAWCRVVVVATTSSSSPESGLTPQPLDEGVTSRTEHEHE